MEQLGAQFEAQSGPKSAQGQAVGMNMDAFSFTDVVRSAERSAPYSSEIHLKNAVSVTRAVLRVSG
jgi:hypothetical protein